MTPEPFLVEDYLGQEAAGLAATTSTSDGDMPVRCDDGIADALEVSQGVLNDPCGAGAVGPSSISVRLIQRAWAENAREADDEIMRHAMTTTEDQEDDVQTWHLIVRALVPGYPGLSQVFCA